MFPLLSLATNGPVASCGPDHYILGKQLPWKYSRYLVLSEHYAIGQKYARFESVDLKNWGSRFLPIYLFIYFQEHQVAASLKQNTSEFDFEEHL